MLRPVKISAIPTLSSERGLPTGIERTAPRPQCLTPPDHNAWHP